MKALVLDFDGVISDSVGEVFIVARRAYLELCPDSELRVRDTDELNRAFRELMPLGNRAEDYGTALLALERRIDLTDQAAYDAFRNDQDEAWLEGYHHRFYDVRASLSDTDPEGWRALMRPYAPLLELLHRRAAEVIYAIATSKDRRSVLIMLDDYGITELFPAELILDKECGPQKTAHLQSVRGLLDVDYAELTFVDDKVNHLDAVAPLGVRCALAAWGYNGTREHLLARERGYLLCTLDDVERQLFSAGLGRRP
jgi:phosphoglycolate phosphatase-like HAD superfamily hydrolase